MEHILIHGQYNAPLEFFNSCSNLPMPSLFNYKKASRIQCSLSSKMNARQTVSLHLKRRDNCEKMRDMSNFKIF